MPTLAWIGIGVVALFLLYFVIVLWKGPKKYRRPLTQVRPRAYQSFQEEDDVTDYKTRRRRQKAMVDPDHTDDYLSAGALASTLNSEDHHVSHRPHYSDLPTPDPEPTSIGGTSHFETGGGFGGDSGFSSGGDIGGSSDGGNSGGGND